MSSITVDRVPEADRIRGIRRSPAVLDEMHGVTPEMMEAVAGQFTRCTISDARLMAMSTPNRGFLQRVSESEFYDEIQGDFHREPLPISEHPPVVLDSNPPTTAELELDTSYWAIGRGDGLFYDLGQDGHPRWRRELPLTMTFPTQRAARHAVCNLLHHTDADRYGLVRVTNLTYMIVMRIQPAHRERVQQRERVASNHPFFSQGPSILLNYDQRAAVWSVPSLATHDTERLEFTTSQSADNVGNAIRRLGKLTHHILSHDEDDFQVRPEEIIIESACTNRPHLTFVPFLPTTTTEANEPELEVYERVVELGDG